MKEIKKTINRRIPINNFMITKAPIDQNANVGILFEDMLACDPQADFAINFRRALSRELLRHCSQQGLTPGKLAQTADMPLSTLNNVLHGNSANTGILTLLEVCQGLEVGLDEVISNACKEARAAIAGNIYQERE